jgi:hypothetical protein
MPGSVRHRCEDFPRDARGDRGPLGRPDRIDRPRLRDGVNGTHAARELYCATDYYYALGNEPSYVVKNTTIRQVEPLWGLS